jgi:hypothetical protein
VNLLDLLGAGKFSLDELLKQAKTPGERAHLQAQWNASLPTKEGGLGLPLTNTPEDRARAMGYQWDNPQFHGSFYDIHDFRPQNASTESFAGAGTYMTPSPEDASLNYASVYGPDVQGKITNFLEQQDLDYRKIHGKLYKEEFSPNQQMKLAQWALNGDNGGVVYPLVHRSDMTAHLDDPKKDSWIEPIEKYNEELDDYETTDTFRNYEGAMSDYSDLYGSEPDELASRLGDEGLLSDESRAGDWFKTIKGVAERQSLENRNGDLMSGGVVAADFLKELGVDTIQHHTDFGKPQLNIGREHTIALDPKNVRSKFAAFDPMKKNSSNILATHPAASTIGLTGLLAAGGMGYSDDSEAAIPASHGSPHLFDKFDFGKIGTGEGAQAYGHGGYFAQGFDSPVAQQYREALSGGAKKAVNASFSDDPELWVAGQLHSGIKPSEITEGLGILGYKGNSADLIKSAENRLKDELSSGHLYNVELKWPDPAREAADPLGEHHLLDWDAALSKQPEGVRRSLSPVFDALEAEQKRVWNTGLPEEDAADVAYHMNSYRNSPMGDNYKRLENLIGSKAEASKFFSDLGIPGIRYLDQGSRGTGTGSRNYVMFDDQIPEIKTRNGEPVKPKVNPTLFGALPGVAAASYLAPSIAEASEDPWEGLKDLTKKNVNTMLDWTPVVGGIKGGMEADGSIEKAINYGSSVIDLLTAGAGGAAAKAALLKGAAAAKGLPGLVAGAGVIDSKTAKAAAEAAKVGSPLPDMLKGKTPKPDMTGYDLFDYSKLNTYPKVAQTELPRKQGVGGRPTERMGDIMDDPYVWENVTKAVKRGAPFKNWYNIRPFADAWLQSNPDPQSLMQFLGYQTISSQRNPVPNQLKTGSYLWHLGENGLLRPESKIELPKGYGGLAQKQIVDDAKKLANGEAIDPLKSPKRSSYIQNWFGNLFPVTADTHGVRLPAMLSHDPRWLAASIGDAGARWSPRNDWEAGKIALPDTLKQPGLWEAAPQGSEYGFMENKWRDVAKEVGVRPGQAQAMGWVGGGGLTGLKSAPKLFLQSIEDRIKATAAARNMTPGQVIDQLAKGKIYLD